VYPHDRPIDQAMLGWSEDRITIITEAVYLPGGRISSDVPPIGLREYLNSLPPPNVAVGRGASHDGDAERPPPSDRAKWLADHPWVMEHLDIGRDILHRKRQAFDAEDASEGSDVDSVYEGEAEYMVSSILASMDEAMDEAAEGAVDHFKVRPLDGGFWREPHGVLIAAWQGLRIVALSETLQRRPQRTFPTRIEISYSMTYRY
jgi:hypothetical protein